MLRLPPITQADSDEHGRSVTTCKVRKPVNYVVIENENPESSLYLFLPHAFTSSLIGLTNQQRYFKWRSPMKKILLALPMLFMFTPGIYAQSNIEKELQALEQKIEI